MGSAPRAIEAIVTKATSAIASLRKSIRGIFRFSSSVEPVGLHQCPTMSSELALSPH